MFWIRAGSYEYSGYWREGCVLTDTIISLLKKPVSSPWTARSGLGESDNSHGRRRSSLRPPEEYKYTQVCGSW